MLASTMNNFKRRAQNSPQRVISPQSRLVNVGIDRTRVLGNNNNLSVINQSKRHVYSSLPRSVAVSPNTRQFQSVGYLSNRNRIDNPALELITFTQIPESYLPVCSNIPSCQIEDNSIIQAINIRPINLNQNSLQIQNDKIICRNSLSSQGSQFHSKLLADQFKTNLQTFEKKKNQQTFESKPQFLTKTDNNQYIIQLLSQSMKTKQMIERLITDNESLMKQNQNLTIDKQEHELLKQSFMVLNNENKSLKEEIKVLLNQQFPSAEVVNIQKEKEVSALNDQINPLRNLLHIKMQQKIPQSTSTQLYQLKIYNTDLTNKIKQLLTQLNRFNHQRMIMIQQNNAFKLCAMQQIQRLTTLLHSYQYSQRQQIPQYETSNQQTIEFQEGINIK